MLWAHKEADYKTGFTIVELLIVVVVIAVLAAITIVAYNGITDRANESAVRLSLSNAQKKVEYYYVENGTSYPASLADVQMSDGDSIKYQYNANHTTTPSGYCVTASTTAKTYHIAKQYVSLMSGGAPLTTTEPESGPCPDHIGVGATITNYVTNPSAETNLSGQSGANSTTIERVTTRAKDGAASILVTMPQNTKNQVGVQFYYATEVSSVFVPGMTYTASAWVYVPSSTVAVRLMIQGAGKQSSGNLSQAVATAKDKWVRIYDTFVAGSSGVIRFYVLNENSTPSAGTYFWADAFMINKSSIPADFASGSSPGWSWNGTSQLSASSGPASISY